MIALENISKEFGTKSLLQSESIQFPAQERIALVGANGAGKTTLLKIISGEEEASSGKILRPNQCRIGHLPQEPNSNPKPTIRDECMSGAQRLSELKRNLDTLTKALETDQTEQNVTTFSQLQEEFERLGGYEIAAEAEKILMGLGFCTAQLDQSPKTLSGGWRMRLELAKLFIDQPDFLILDEPTNHLDLPSLIWVEKYLLNFKGTLLFVSHDQDLLNKLSTVTVEIRSGRLKLYRGNFDAFLHQKMEHKLQQEAMASQIEKKRRHMQEFVDRFGAKATKARQAQSRVKMIAKLKSLESEIDHESDLTEMSLTIPKPEKSGREILKVTHGSIGYGDVILQSNINVLLERGAKVAIIGSNGIGKSTFLKTVCGIIPDRGGEFTLGHNVAPGYFAQDQLETLDLEKSVLENATAVGDHIGENMARSLLGSFLFHGDDVFKKVKVLSGGEKSRVGLATALLRKTNFLILDEPTNHLDMSSVEILIDALGQYEGSVLFVSHNRTFINRVATHILAMTQTGESLIVEGTLPDYERLAAVANFTNVLEIQEPATAQVTPGAPSRSKTHREYQKALQRLKGRQQKLEKKMEEEKKQLTKIKNEMTQLDPSDHHALSEATNKMEAISQNIESHEESWLELEEQIEGLGSP